MDEKAGDDACYTGIMDRAQREEVTAVMRGVGDTSLNTHGEELGRKKDGIIRLIYENVNGLSKGATGNRKVEKARAIHDDLEVDIVAYNEHHINLRHKRNTFHFSDAFNGGESEIRVVAAHNVHENVGKVQEGGTAMMVFGPLIEHLDQTGSSKDESGLGRWVVMSVRGETGTTRIVCGYNPCGNARKESNTSFQQHR